MITFGIELSHTTILVIWADITGFTTSRDRVLGSIPGIDLREMKRSYSRSFCCSGGGLLIWYENEEEKERMGERRVRMAEEIGAQVIVTACPFCLINLEDAIKTTGNEGKIEVIDLVELTDRSMLT